MDSVNRGLDLEKELTCSICTEVLYEPLTLLDCLHTYCGACLKEWFGCQLAAARGHPSTVLPGSTPYTCPSCRSPVRDTKRQATVVTLLEMFLVANPGKDRSEEEKEELKKKYQPGNDVIPKVEEHDMSPRELMAEQADRRLINAVRYSSLAEAGLESPEARRARRRRDEARSYSTSTRRSRENSQDSRESRDGEGRERRRRTEGASDSERRRRRDGEESATLRPDDIPGEHRRQRRSQDDATRRHEETNRTVARNLEHQSSLRSLLSSSDVDSQEMQTEILRQIHEEGLLDGIDLENIEGNHERISDRIAEAWRRQRERSNTDSSRTNNPRTGRRSGHSPRSASTDRSGNSGNGERRVSPRHRTYNRSSSPTRRANEASTVYTNGSTSHLEAHHNEAGRRGGRSTSEGRSSTSPIPVTTESTRPAARSQTDLSSDRSRPSRGASSSPQVASQGRSTTDPTQSQSQLPSLSSSSSSSSATVGVPESQSPQQMASPIFQSIRNYPTGESEGAAMPAELPSPDLLIIPVRTRVAPPVELPTTLSNARTPAPPPAPISVVNAESSTLSLTTTHTSRPDHDQSLTTGQSSPETVRQSHGRSVSSPSDRAATLQTGVRPTSSGSTGSRLNLPRFPEPSITCSRCAKLHIEYEIHYSCSKCSHGNWNICLNCYRSGRGCLHWFGFGNAGWAKWEKQIGYGQVPKGAELPHLLSANRYIPPRTVPGGADGRRTLTNENPEKRLQSGAFCSNCLAWANECYWRCDLCNENDWGFCNNCVNQGKCCTHPLLPLIYQPEQSEAVPLSPIHNQQTPSSATVLSGPDVVKYGNFKPLSFRVSCDICRYPIQPSSTRYHCFSCSSAKSPNRTPGDYDICTNCYHTLQRENRISAENGHAGWRRCPQGHRMIIVGFDSTREGQHRLVVTDLVGGRKLHEEPSKFLDHAGLDLQQWSWLDSSQVRLVTTDVAATAPTTSTSLILAQTFPPDGGFGLQAVATWSWYPKEGEGENELLFPRGAEVREVVDVNGDWFHGVYMGVKGLFPAPYVKLINA